MAEQHRATAEEWDDVVTHSCILELRDRVEALETKDEGAWEALAAMRKAGRSADLQIKALIRRIEALEAAQHAQPNHPEKPDSSLVERVAAAIHPNVCADPNLYLHEARAAIREVAAWLQEKYGRRLATIDLEQEAER